MQTLRTLILAAIAVILFSFSAAPTRWNFDVYHSKLGFSITHLMVTDVEGSFKIKEASIVAPRDNDFTDAVVTLVADINSVQTDNEQRDAELKKPDIFHAEQYPTLTFKSTSFKKTGERKYLVTGDLTLKGVTKPVTLEAVARLGANPMNNKPIAGFKVSGTIKRTDFGIASQTPSALLSDEVAITANLEFTKE
jgi:polyisoprenoid-binding protein YceI